MFSSPVDAQESLRELSSNPFLQQKNNTFRQKAGSDTITLHVPILDDFSSSTIYPDKHKWVEDDVYINSTFPINPLSVGVATFDCLDANGHLYNPTDTTSYIQADQLTSRKINLNYPNRSDVYLSFFYEPGGLGSLPEISDSLIVDFWSPSGNTWTKIWGAAGDTMSHQFRQAMIPITQPDYLQNGFRFRFRNLVTMGTSSTSPDGKNYTNNDFWHIDYVRLDTGRNVNDTLIRDVAFVEPMGSLLKNYQSVPWDHFKAGFANLIQPQVTVTYRNNDKKLHSVFRNFVISDLYGTDKSEFSAGREDIEAGQNFVLKTDLVNPFITSSVDSALFESKAYLETDVNDLKSNDTIRYHQIFNRYFAHDDGSPEFGYGLDNDKGGMVAYQFKSFITDTLVALQLFFNAGKWESSSNHYFKLAIWSDNNGRPGNLIYQKSSDDYSVDSIQTNSFNTFKLDSSILLKGIFYIGWIQSDYFFMNVGYDLNNNSDAFTLYNSNGNWVNSQLHGSLMMRPVFRHQKSVVTGNDVLVGSKFSVYPNPVKESLKVIMPSETDTRPFKYSLYNITGMKVREAFFDVNDQINVSDLPSGIYLLKLTGNNTSYQPVKILIEK